MSLVCLDSSALVKLVVREPESAALLKLPREHREQVASALVLTEVPRALRRAGFGRVRMTPEQGASCLMTRCQVKR